MREHGPPSSIERMGRGTAGESWATVGSWCLLYGQLDAQQSMEVDAVDEKMSDMCKGCEINRPEASFATVLWLFIM
jgi:hypothetical protein